MPIRIFAGLIFFNLVWSATPVMGKWLLVDFEPAHAAWLRYSSALVAFAVMAAILGIRRDAFVPKGAGVRDWALFAWVGFMAFTFSPLLTLTGLNASRAVDQAIIIAMEPLVTVFLAWIILRERLSAAHLAAFVAAVAGFALLSGIRPGSFSGISEEHLWGNLLILVSLAGEATYSVIGRKLTLRFPPLAIFGPAILIGVLILTAVTYFLAGFPEFSALTTRSFLALLWMGPLATAGGYAFWMWALTRLQVATVVLSLFIQPVAGAILGYALLGEAITWIQILGAILILIAVAGLGRYEYLLSVRRRTPAEPAKA